MDSQSYSEWMVPGLERDNEMPTVLECLNHPLLTEVEHVGRVFVMLVKTDVASMEEQYRYERALQVPDGEESSWATRGLIRLESGDYVFVRDALTQATGRRQRDIAKKDVLAVVATGRRHHTAATLNDVEKAVNQLVGDGAQGTTELEKTECAKRVKGGRCYSLASTVEPFTNLCGPAAVDSGKKGYETFSLISKETVTAGSKMVAEIVRALPTAVKDAVQANKEVVNHPSAGVAGNFMAPNVQVNISPIPKEGYDTCNGLEADLGQFGSAHIDSNDHPAYLTVMLALPQLSTHRHPGYFHLLQLGVYTSLSLYRGVVFSGRRKHGATPPTAISNGTYARENEFRISLVFYPTQHCVDGSSRFVVCSGSGKPMEAGEKKAVSNKAKGGSKLFCITPEMQNVKDEPHIEKATNRSTYANEGHRVMDDNARANWLGRAGLQVFTWMLRHAAGNLSFSVDQKQFMESVSYRDYDGKWKQLDEWRCAPDVETVRPARALAQAKFAQYSRNAVRFIPSVAAKLKTDGVGEDDFDGEVSETEDVDDEDHVQNKDLLQEQDKSPSGADGISERSTSTDRRSTPLANSSTTDGIRGGEGSSKGYDEAILPFRRVNDGTVDGRGRPRSKNGNGRYADVGRSGSLEPMTITEEDCAVGSGMKITAATGKRSINRESSGAEAARKKQKKTFKLLDSIAADSIGTDLSKLEGELIAVWNSSDPNSADAKTSELFQQLSVSTYALNAQPLSPDSPAHARQVHELATKCEGVVQTDQLYTRLRRMQVMLSLSRARRWVEIDITDLAKSRMSQHMIDINARLHDWLDDLVSILTGGLRNGVRDIVIDPGRYPRLRTIASGPFVYTNPHHPRRYVGIEDQARLYDSVIDSLRIVLPRWLGFAGGNADDERTDRVRAWVIDALQDVLGPLFLTTDIAWAMFTTFKIGHVIHSDKVRRSATPSHELLIPFIEDLKAHPICDHTTYTGAMWARYKGVIEVERKRRQERAAIRGSNAR